MPTMYPSGVLCSHVSLRVYHTQQCTSGCTMPSSVPQGVHYPPWVSLGCTLPTVGIPRVCYTSGCGPERCIPQGVVLSGVYLRVYTSGCWLFPPRFIPPGVLFLLVYASHRGLFPRGWCLSSITRFTVGHRYSPLFSPVSHCSERFEPVPRGLHWS